MYKFSNVNIEKYMFDTELKKSCPSLERQCFAFGYLDGYFKEEVYEDLLDFKENMFVAYNLGYRQGESARLDKRQDVQEYEEWKKEKDTWIKSLAEFDAKNFVSGRRFSANSKPFYEKYYEDFEDNNLDELENIEKPIKSKVKK